MTGQPTRASPPKWTAGTQGDQMSVTRMQQELSTGDLPDTARHHISEVFAIIGGDIVGSPGPSAELASVYPGIRLFTGGLEREAGAKDQ